MQTSNPNKTIIIGCDQLIDLTFIINGINLIKLDGYSIVTVSRVSELIQMVTVNSPELIIISFQNNQIALNEINAHFKSDAFTTFCLTKEKVIGQLKWPKEQAVITFPTELAKNQHLIGRQILSMLQLVNSKAQTATKTEANTQPQVQDLTKYILELDQKLVLIDRLKKEIEQVSFSATDPIRRRLNSMINLIKQVKVDRGHWQDFGKYFNSVHSDFLEVLSEKYPGLTTKDLKYCCYLKMNLSNNEITRLMGVNQESVRTHKYRLKKKMALSKEQDLSNYLIRFNNDRNLKIIV